MSNSTNTDTDIASTEIISCFGTWTDAWNAGDVDGFLDGYYDSDSVRYVGGETVIRGKNNIVQHFRSRGATGTLSLVHFEVDFISPEDAICFGQYHVVDDEEEIHEGYFTAHVRRIGDSWKIVSDHSS